MRSLASSDEVQRTRRLLSRRRGELLHARREGVALRVSPVEAPQREPRQPTDLVEPGAQTPIGETELLAYADHLGRIALQDHTGRMHQRGEYHRVQAGRNQQLTPPIPIHQLRQWQGV